MGECFNCGRAASRSYTLVFDTGLRLEDRLLCTGCYAFFNESSRIEVLEAPLVATASRGVVEEAEE